MFILNIICVGILFVTVGILGIRLIIQYQLAQVKDDSQQTLNFRRKLRIVKHLENQKHITYLMVTSGLFGFALLLLLISFFRMGAQIDTARLRVEQLEEEVQKVKSEQKTLISKVPLRNYPKEGLGLKGFSWKDVFNKEKQAALQPKIETSLSQTLSPYFGLAQVIVSIDVPSQTLSISLTGNTENMDNQKMIETNVQALVEEAKEIPRLTQIHIEVVMTAEKKGKTIYNETFLRKQDDQTFSKLEKTASEQKGKG